MPTQEKSSYILAIDIGGTKISAALVDETGQVTHRQETLTLSHEGREGILNRVEKIGSSVLANAPEARVLASGIASAGQIEPTGRTVFYATENLPGWSGLHLSAAVEAMFGIPTVADNDVNAMAVAEMHSGAGRGFSDALCVMVGTGIGGAVFQNGALVHGARGGAGEFGHIPVQTEGGRPCNCGSSGCVEVYSSSRSMVLNLIERAGGAEIERLLQKPAEQISIQNIAAAYQNPNYADWRALHATVEEAATFLGAALAAGANLLDPQVIIIAGSIQLLGNSYLELLRRAFLRRAMQPRRAIQIVYSSLGADPTLIGAALLARQRFLQEQ